MCKLFFWRNKYINKYIYNFFMILLKTWIGASVKRDRIKLSIFILCNVILDWIDRNGPNASKWVERTEVDQIDWSGLDGPKWTRWTKVNQIYGNTMPMWLNKSLAIRNVTLKLLDEQYSPVHKCICLFVIEVYLEDEDWRWCINMDEDEVEYEALSHFSSKD